MQMNLPNKLTILRVLMVPLFIACFYLPVPWWRFLAAAIFFAADMTDILDGYLARSRNLVTNFGKLMDPMADKLLFCSAFIMLTWLGELSPLLTILFISRELLISAFRLITAASGTVIAANWLGKLKSTWQVIAILDMLLGNPFFERIGFPMDRVLMWTAGVLTVWSMVDYIIKNHRAVKWD